ncbi:MAG: CpsD/CapB family tyrosine-protein kinase [bacterium]
MNKELIVHYNPKSYSTESIKMVRTSIEHFKTSKSSSILITSSVPGEGKSFISSNLAIAFAQLNKKVILIDCDLRKGRVHKIFDVDNLLGMSNLLVTNEVGKIEDFIIHTEYDKLDIIPRGKVPYNPSELLTYKISDIIIEDLKNKYDVVIVDGTPVIGLSDSIILSKKVDMTVLVSAINTTTTDMLISAKKSLESVECNLIGIVANKAPKNKSRYYEYK